MSRRDFDPDPFLRQPLVGRLASTGPDGPVVRPVWYLWEDGAFWWLTGSWSSLAAQLRQDPRVSLVIDTCDLDSGEIRQVTARGRAQLVAYDPDRARRKLSRYLGDDPDRWDQQRFGVAVVGDPATSFVELRPDTLTSKDLSYRPAGQ